MSLVFEGRPFIFGPFRTRNPPSSLALTATDQYSDHLQNHHFEMVYHGACQSLSFGSHLSFVQPDEEHIQCYRGDVLVFGDHITGEYQEGGTAPFVPDFKEIVQIIDVEQQRGRGLLGSFRVPKGPRLSHIQHWRNLRGYPDSSGTRESISAIAALLQHTTGTEQMVTLAIPFAGISPEHVHSLEADVRSRIYTCLSLSEVSVDDIASAGLRLTIQVFRWGDGSQYDKAMELHEEAKIRLDV
jgi:hypothetical protein